MDDSSTDEQEFPGLYTEKGKRNEENESNSSENFVEKTSKKSKDKKDKKDKSDRQYEALGAESDEDAESKLFRSPSKSKKSKTFKFPTSAKKRTEKSKERESDVKDTPDGKDKKEKKEKKEHKEKDKKEKKKEKSKGISNDVSEPVEIFRVFGMSLGLAVERSKCHDGIKLPLVVRNCIDYLQDNLNSEQIYKVEGLKTRIQNLKKCYNNREPITEEMDVATASTLLKTYISELPEPILTTELTARFEEVSALPEVTTQAKEFSMLIDQLPKVNQVLLAWISRHLSAVIAAGKSNKMNAQSLAVLLSPILQMSHRLLITLLCHADLLFADVHLEKYVPPINASTSPNLPETVQDIQLELRKQESLLNQIHAEMNAGLHSKKREEELWETQRIITQLKRKLRTFEKKQDSMQKSMDADAIEEAIDFTLRKPIEEDEETAAMRKANEIEISTQETESVRKTSTTTENIDKVYVAENGLFMLPKEHPDHQTLIRLQLENQELMNWKQHLQMRINSERAECVRLKKIYDAQQLQSQTSDDQTNLTSDDPEYDRLVEHYLKENALLEQKRLLLSKEIVDENLSLIQLQVELAMKHLVH